MYCNAIQQVLNIHHCLYVHILDHIFSTLQNGEIGNKSCYYLSTLLDTEHVFTLLYKQFTSSPHKLVKVTFLSSHVGSDKLKKVCTYICTKFQSHYTFKFYYYNISVNEGSRKKEGETMGLKPPLRRISHRNYPWG